MQKVHASELTKIDETAALAAKVRFLSCPEAYDPRPSAVVCRETHMSWVFLADDQVYKLKKPVRFPYLDFSTVDRREWACRNELRLSRRLAPDVYLGVIPLKQTTQGLALGGEGATVDWLVHMRRLDERSMLDRMIGDGRLTARHIERLVEVLARFYRAAEPVPLSPDVYLAGLDTELTYNHRILLDRRLGLPAGLVRRIDRAQRLFLARYKGLIADRFRHRHIVEGHGDLRPEHICLDHEVRIIDALEFNVRLRVVDPFDEVAFLCLECERLEARWAADLLRRRMMHALRDGPADALFTFYHCYRATLRARLAIAHLLEPQPRTPEKWPRVTADYLALAARSARKLESLLRMRSDRRDRALRAGV